MTTLLITILILAAAYYLIRQLNNKRATPTSETDTAGTAGDFKMWVVRGATGKKELVVDKPNAIQAHFKSGLAAALDAAGGPLMDTTNLFTDDEVRHSGDGGSGTQDGKDGIIISRDQNVDGRAVADAYTMITTQIAAINTYGKRFKGTITFNQSMTVDSATIGNDFVGETIVNTPDPTPYFSSRYAYNTFTGVPVQAADKIIIEWELYIT